MKCLNLRICRFLLLLLSITACETELPTGETDLPISNRPTEKDELKISDISGVWIDYTNDKFFLTIYPDGRYSYCFSDYILSSGICELGGSDISFTDGYSHVTDKMSCSLGSDKSVLSIGGQLQPIPGFSDEKKYVSFKLIRSKTETPARSLFGFDISCEDQGLWRYYSEVFMEYHFNSDYYFNLKYTGKHKDTKKWKTISNHSYRYVYRPPYIYCYDITDNDYLIKRYDFCFLRGECYHLDYGMDNHEVY